MKKLVILISVVLLVGVCLWPAISVRRTYYKIINECGPQPYSVVKMDDTMKALLEDVRTNWSKMDWSAEDAYSSCLDTIGAESSVSNLILFINYRPKHFFLNKEDVIIGTYQSLLYPRSIDNSIYLSDDNQTALIRVRTNAFSVFTTENGELKESIYFNLKDNGIEPVK